MISQITNEVCFYAEKISAPDATWSPIPVPPENASAVLLCNYAAAPGNFIYIRFDGDSGAATSQGYILAAGQSVVIKGAVNVQNILVEAASTTTTELIIFYYKG